jgi:hypothetical protein
VGQGAAQAGTSATEGGAPAPPTSSGGALSALNPMNWMGGGGGNAPAPGAGGNVQV